VSNSADPAVVVLPPTFYTGTRIVNLAMRDAGLLSRGQEPDSEDYAEYGGRLNEMLLFAQTQGLKLWLQFLQPVTLIAGKALYTMMPGGDVNIIKPSRIIEGYYLDSTGNQRPLIPLAWSDWNRLSNKTQSGQVNSYFVDKQTYQINLSFWNTPDVNAATGTCQMQIQQQQQTVTTLSETMSLPPEWGIWAHWGLADQICTGQPQAIMDRCEKRAGLAFEALNDWDVEDADTSFAPDIRGISAFQNPRG
jgi:hypothetical protein